MLLLLQQNGPTTQARLTRSLGIDPRNMGPVLTRLEARRLADRRTDQADRRRRLVRLTPDGTSVAQAILVRSDHITEQFFAPLTQAERDELSGLLRRLHEAHTA